MGILTGRKACNENTDWVVNVVFNHGECSLIEQVNFKEAKAFYEKLKKQIEAVKGKSRFVEVLIKDDSYGNKTKLINLSMVEIVVLKRD